MDILERLSWLSPGEHTLALLAVLVALQWLLARRRIRAAENRQCALSDNLNRVQSESSLVLNEKNVFIKNLSYELRIPLSQVIESLKLFSAKEVPEWQKSHLAKIALAAESLDRVVSGLVDYAAIVNNESVLSDISFSVKKKFTRFVNEAQDRKSGLTVVHGNSLDEMADTKVIGDPVRLGQMLESLLEVFDAYASNNSLVFFDAAHRVRDDGTTVVEFLFRGEELRLCPTDQQRIAEALSQSALAENFRFGDVSFNLFICHQLALRMKGKLRIAGVSEDRLEFRLRVAFPVAQTVVSSQGHTKEAVSADAFAGSARDAEIL